MINLIEKIQKDFPLTTAEIKLLLITAPRRYKFHEIEKRHGRGKRLIAQPTSEIKILQRWAAEKCLNQLPIHDAATAYRKGTSIKQHASIHANNKYLLKLDFENFFPSIKASDFIKHANSFSELSQEDIRLLSLLFFRRDLVGSELILSVGAPSSPTLSNTVMYPFDLELSNYCTSKKITYSRYADDIALSTNQPKALDAVHEFIKMLCQSMHYPKLSLNIKKTVFTSQKHSRQLTGLILSNTGTASLGRDKKREIRSMAHHFSLGKLETTEINRLRGLLAFSMSIEPNFVKTINKMIGNEVFNRLVKLQNISS